jgi:polyhydroxyalkanoate synthesis regulator phasin
MAIVSRKKAGELTGKSHATIYRHLRSGKLSKTSNGDITTSELKRVYGELQSTDEEDTPEPIKAALECIYQKDKSDTELKLMREQIDLLKQQLAKTETLLEHSHLNTPYTIGNFIGSICGVSSLLVLLFLNILHIRTGG